MNYGKIINLNELPRYSEWPDRLTGISAFTVRKKTHKEVIREFNTDKWGALLRRVLSQKGISISDVDNIVYQDSIDTLLPCWNGKDFVLESETTSMENHFTLYSHVLSQYLKHSTGLCELGAGYGRVILNLARLLSFKDLDIYAADLTEAGQKLIQILSANMGIPVHTGFCDFRGQLFKNLDMNTGAVLYTSYSVHYVPELPDNFPDFLLSKKPSTVIHFEPCFEHHDEQQLYGLLCKKYIKLNDYNTNLLTVLKKAEKAGKIEVLEERKNVIGSNPFLPISVIAWRGC